MIQIEYLIYVLENKVPQDHLVELFKEKGIFLNPRTIDDIQQLQNFYQQITEIYHNSPKQFIKALKKSVLKHPDFTEFPRVFTDFYLTFIKALFSLVSRSEVIKYYLQFPNIDSLVVNYDTYFEGRVIHEFNVPEGYEFRGLLHGKVILLNNEDGYLLYDKIQSDKYAEYLDENVGVDITNGKVILTLPYEIKQWDPQTNKFTTLFDSEDEIMMSAISSDGTILIDMEENFQILKNGEITEIPGIKKYGFLGNQVVLVSEEGIYLWDGQFKKLDIIPDIDMDYKFRGNKIIRYNRNLLEVYSSKLIFTIEEDDDILIQLVSDDLLMIYRNERNIIDLNTGKLYTTLRLEGGEVLWLPGDKFAIAYIDHVDITDKCETVESTIVENHPSIKFVDNKLIIYNDNKVIIMV